MGLKNRFILLMTGIILLPIISVGLFFFSARLFSPQTADRTFTPQYQLVQEMHTYIAKAIVNVDFSELEKRFSQGGFRIERADTGEIIRDFPGSMVAKVTDEISFNLSIDKVSYHVNIGVPIVSSDSSKAYRAMLPVLAFGSVLLFTIIITIGILRNLKHSIGVLDAATQQISAGNLDFKLELPPGDSLAPLATSMDSMRQSLREEYARKDRFILAVSHDLKSPLAVLEGYLEAFEDGLVDNPEKREQYLRVMREKTGLLSYRISHLVELAKMTTMEWRQTLVATELSRFLEESFGHIADEVNADGGILNVDLKVEPGLSVSINHDMVVRVFENLIDNARTYSPPGSPVSVSAWNTNFDAFVSITNSGPGIPPEQASLVFEPFFRGDSSRNSGGFGLGLASVKTIVETHGWFISLESNPGARTCFTIRIPLCGAGGRESE